MSPEKDCLDVTLDIVLDAEVGRALISTALVDAIANGKLFLLSNSGEYVCVEMASYWKDNALLTVCRQGYEFNEDGETTRDWRTNAQ